MPYVDYQNCKLDDREILHGQTACLKDKCVKCVDGNLEEDYENVYGGLA